MPILPSGSESTSRSHRDFEPESSLPSTRRDPPGARRLGHPPEALLDRHVERQPASTEYLAFVTHLGSASAAGSIAASTTREAQVQAKLDAVRDAFSGPYRVAGELITARPMFRMTTHRVSNEVVVEVDARGARAGINAVPTRMGQGTPRELVKLTQALLDAGRLPPGPGDLASRIRRMQWQYGIGVDCAGYSKQALAACSARVPKMYAPGMESFRDLDRARAGSFARQPLTRARPGDLITLDGRDGGWGHNVVVYRHDTADAAMKASLGTSDPRVRAFLSSAGPHHVIEVDSSWGAGADGAEEGGYRRDTWLYDESTRTWGSFEPATRVFVESTRGPADDDYHGTYRPR